MSSFGNAPLDPYYNRTDRPAGGGGGGGGAVVQITAGAGIAVAPPAGTGTVTVTNLRNNLINLEDVTAPNPQNDQVLQYDGVSGFWEAKTLTTPPPPDIFLGGQLLGVGTPPPAVQLSTLRDVFMPEAPETLERGNYLAWDPDLGPPRDNPAEGLKGAWNPQLPRLTNNVDVELTGAPVPTGHGLTYNGTKWVNTAPSNVAHTLNDHTDVNHSAVGGEVLHFDNTDSQWKHVPELTIHPTLRSVRIATDGLATVEGQGGVAITSRVNGAIFISQPTTCANPISFRSGTPALSYVKITPAAGTTNSDVATRILDNDDAIVTTRALRNEITSQISGQFVINGNNPTGVSATTNGANNITLAVQGPQASQINLTPSAAVQSYVRIGNDFKGDPETYRDHVLALTPFDRDSAVPNIALVDSRIGSVSPAPHTHVTADITDRNDNLFVINGNTPTATISLGTQNIQALRFIVNNNESALMTQFEDTFGSTNKQTTFRSGSAMFINSSGLCQMTSANGSCRLISQGTGSNGIFFQPGVTPANMVEIDAVNKGGNAGYATLIRNGNASCVTTRQYADSYIGGSTYTQGTLVKSDGLMWDGSVWRNLQRPIGRISVNANTATSLVGSGSGTFVTIGNVTTVLDADGFAMSAPANGQIQNTDGTYTWLFSVTASIRFDVTTNNRMCVGRLARVNATNTVTTPIVSTEVTVTSANTGRSVSMTLLDLVSLAPNERIVCQITNVDTADTVGIYGMTISAVAQRLL